MCAKTQIFKYIFVFKMYRTNVYKLFHMETMKIGKIIMRISWTETLRAMEVDDVIEASLADRINIVRHISRISKSENKKFCTEKIDEKTVLIKRKS